MWFHPPQVGLGLNLGSSLSLGTEGSLLMPTDTPTKSQGQVPPHHFTCRNIEPKIWKTKRLSLFIHWASLSWITILLLTSWTWSKRRDPDVGRCEYKHPPAGGSRLVLYLYLSNITRLWINSGFLLILNDNKTIQAKLLSLVAWTLKREHFPPRKSRVYTVLLQASHTSLSNTMYRKPPAAPLSFLVAVYSTGSF